MNIKEKFTDADLERIRQAVSKAESKISGEIVPVIVERSGHYLIANYKGALLGASLAAVSMIILDRFVLTTGSSTLFYDPVFLFAMNVLGGLLGALLTSVSDSIRRRLVSRQYLDSATRQRAEAVFLEEEVFNTRQRTGIMIFISLFEHEVIIMADSGISKAVTQDVWDNIVKDIITEIRTGHLTDGLEKAILRCGEILLDKGFFKTDDDINELRDELRID